MREIVNAIFYVLRSGCAWRLLPDSFPPRQTVYGWFRGWRDDCVLERLNHLWSCSTARAAGAPPALRRGARQPERQDDGGRRPAGLRRRQEDQGQKAPRPRRHRRASPPASTCTRPTSRTATAAGRVLAASRHAFPFIAKAFADSRLRREAGCQRPPPSPSRSFARPRPDRLRRPAPALGRRALLRLDRPQPPPRQGFRGNPRIRASLPLRRLHHAAHRRLAQSG